MSASTALRLVQPSPPAAALGMAVEYLMTRAPFTELSFGSWSQALHAQVMRGHYAFAVQDGRAVGFMGWARTTDEKGLAWLEHDAPLLFADSLQGDCIVFNAWAADTREAHMFLYHHGRKLLLTCKTAYAKRYRNGTVRRDRLAVNSFIGGHLERAELESPPLQH